MGEAGGSACGGNWEHPVLAAWELETPRATQNEVNQIQRTKQCKGRGARRAGVPGHWQNSAGQMVEETWQPTDIRKGRPTESHMPPQVPLAYKPGRPSV